MTMPKTLTIIETAVPNRSAKNKPIGMYAKDVTQTARLACITTTADVMLLGRKNFNMNNKKMSSIDDNNVYRAITMILLNHICVKLIS